MKELIVPTESAQKKKFRDNLQLINTVLKDSGVSFAVVGGIALRATVGTEFTHRRTNGTLLDIDAIALGPDRPTIEKAKNQLRKLADNSELFPEVGLEPIIFGAEKKRNLLEALSSIKLVDGRYYLVYRDIEQPVSADSMRLIERWYGEVRLPTFCAEVTYRRYEIRGGMIKEKDQSKLGPLQMYYINHLDEQLSDDDRQSYNFFLMQWHQKYAYLLLGWEVYWAIDRLTGDKISGSKGRVSRLGDIFVR